MRTSNDLTEYEIVALLHERVKANRRVRLQKFRQTGRIISIVGDPGPTQQLNPVTALNLQESKNQNGRRLGKFASANGMLRTIEIISFLCLIAIIAYGGKTLVALNSRSRTDWGGFSITPTPIIRAMVLPDGHTPPTSPGGARPRDSEIPAHLRPQVAAYYNLPTPTAAPHQGIRIQIPALEVDAPIIQGDGWEQLKKGVAQHLNTANPGEKGNLVLSGHNDIYGEVFRYLDRLKAGDEVIIYTHTRSYTYIVDSWFLVEPDQVEVMDPTPDETLTLISCYPYLIDSDRIIVKANLSKG